MLRVLIFYVLPLLLPALLYLLWVILTQGRPQPEWLRQAPWGWLGLTGVVLLVVSMTVWALVGGEPPGGKYQPPQLKDGEIVPGRVVR